MPWNMYVMKTVKILKKYQKTNVFTSHFLGPIKQGSMWDLMNCKEFKDTRISTELRAVENVMADRNHLKSEHSIEWYSEFIDLIFVAATYNLVSNLNYQIKYDIGDDVYEEIAELFIV
eukprot:UN00130